MFHNRFNREYPFDTRRTFVRPTYGYLSMGFSGARSLQLMETPSLHSWNWGQWNNLPTATAPADVLELDEQFIIELALPGVVLDDVQLKIEGCTLTVCAKRTPTLFEEKAVILQKELPMIYMVRQFEFETPIVGDHIEARLDRGILYVSIPKMEAALRIPVSAGSIESHVPGGVKTRVSSKQEASVK